MDYNWSDNDYVEQLRRRKVNLLRMSDRIYRVDGAFARILIMKAQQVERMLNKFVERRVI